MIQSVQPEPQVMRFDLADFERLSSVVLSEHATRPGTPAIRSRTRRRLRTRRQAVRMTIATPEKQQPYPAQSRNAPCPQSHRVEKRGRAARAASRLVRRRRAVCCHRSGPAGVLDRQAWCAYVSVAIAAAAGCVADDPGRGGVREPSQVTLGSATPQWHDRDGERMQGVNPQIQID
jgi:hypothetical protein